MSINHKQLPSFALPTAPPVVQPAISLHTQRGIFRAALLMSDSLMILLAFSLAYWVRFDLNLTLSPEIVPPPGFYALLTLALVPAWLVLFAAFRLYDFHYLLGGTNEYSRAFNACTFGMMVVIFGTFIVPSIVVARVWLFAAWFLSVLLVCSARFWLRRAVYGLREYGYFLSPAAVVGTNEEAVALAEQLRGWRRSGLRVIGFISVDDSSGQANLGNIPVLGASSHIRELSETYALEELIVATTDIGRDAMLQLFDTMEDLNGTELRLSSGLFEVLTTGVQVKTLGSVPLMTLNKLRLDPIENALKSTLDYVLATLTLLCLIPLFTAIAILIKLDSPGPVFYRRRVLGLGRKEFDALKFRTMHVNGDEILAQQPALLEELRKNEKLKDDPRVTRMGQWLRRYSIDELPQLVNVLRGHMSLVGPRIITPEEATRYGRYRINLFTVKPGLTGLWQVSGRSDLSYEERVRLDMHYIRTYTIWQDLHILFIRTPPAVLKGNGAY